MITLAAMVVFGALFHRGVYHPLRARKSFISVIVSTIGASLFLKNTALLIFGADPRVTPPVFSRSSVGLFGVFVAPQYLVILGTLLVMVVFQYLLFEKTMLGKRMRATAQDRDMARLVGIRVDRVILLTFIYAAVLGSIGGILLAPIFYVSSTMGFLIAVKGFSSSVVGGLVVFPARSSADCSSAWSSCLGPHSCRRPTKTFSRL